MQNCVIKRAKIRIFVGWAVIAEKLDNNKQNSPFDKSWIEEISVKDLIEKPVTENVTTLIYKVTALVKKVPGTGFVNYYINDLNRKDSLMAYTQSNGKDYKWTNEYDGKTVEMLIIVSIAKPGVNSWRFCPVEILDDDVKVSAEEEATYAAERALDNFSDTYNVNTIVEFSKEDQYLLEKIADKISKLYEMLPQWIKNEYDVVITMPCYLEITKKNVCKYNSVIYLAKYLGINENEIMAIGDSMNDLSMIKNCHYGVAMGNAIEEIKDAAKIITCDNNSSGVARIINFCL